MASLLRTSSTVSVNEGGGQWRFWQEGVNWAQVATVCVVSILLTALYAIQASMCYNCQRGFNAMRHRHHCRPDDSVKLDRQLGPLSPPPPSLHRCCCNSFCHSCSQWQAPKPDGTLERVCEECFYILQLPPPSLRESSEQPASPQGSPGMALDRPGKAKEGTPLFGGWLWKKNKKRGRLGSFWAPRYFVVHASPGRSTLSYYRRPPIPPHPRHTGPGAEPWGGALCGGSTRRMQG